MRWLKKGLVYAPDGKFDWRKRYAMMPTPEFIEKENIIRIYYGTTDYDIHGRTTYLDVDADNPNSIVSLPDFTVLDIGKPGMFDDSGAVPSSVVITPDNSKLLYYVGFQRCQKVPYMLFTGLAKYEDAGFVRISEAPVVDRYNGNSVSNGAPFVMYDEGLAVYKMWFWKGKEWVMNNGKLYVKAEIHYTTSVDGINWERETTPCIVLDDNTEFSVGRPCVLIQNGLYKMWYSVRKKDVLYRIGYAESVDGINWVRKDEEVGIDVSESGWDEEMICYPSVIEVKGKTYMFYNGNNNGASGFGVAELIAE